MEELDALSILVKTNAPTLEVLQLITVILHLMLL
jgi:hypothetical protein